MLIVTAEEMRALDKHTIDTVGVPGAVLMEAAGRGVVEVIAGLVDATRARVVVYAGAGNNGGDGFVVARHLANGGAEVDVILCVEAAKVKGDAGVHFDAMMQSPREPRLHEALDRVALDRACAATAQAEVVVDAIFGTGLQRPVEGHLAEVIARINAHAGLKVAVDIPSGLSADAGVPLGVCVRADHTVTFAFAKRGLVGAPGFVYTGRLHVVDIGIPVRLAADLGGRGVRARLLDDEVLRPLAAVDPLAHKGTRGHALLVAGSIGKTGAALLCGLGALRGGAGLVTVAAPEEARASLDGRVPELMTAWYGDLAQAGDVIEPLLDGKRALAMGPGIATAPAMRPVLARLVAAAQARGTAVVLDADALNHLAAEPALVDGARGPVVLTPHPGEAARLLGCATADIARDRYAAAVELAARFQSVVALKGARTVIAAPPRDGGAIAVSPTGNPGLGSGGTGDVLTGCIAALLARGLQPFDAACAGVYLHGAAADLVADEAGMIGLLSSDVAHALPRVVKARTR